MADLALQPVADIEDAHFDGQQPVGPLVLNRLRPRVLGQHQPAHQGIVVDMHIVDNAVDSFSLIGRLGLYQAAETGLRELAHPAADGEAGRTGPQDPADLRLAALIILPFHQSLVHVISSFRSFFSRINNRPPHRPAACLHLVPGLGRPGHLFGPLFGRGVALQATTLHGVLDHHNQVRLVLPADDGDLVGPCQRVRIMAQILALVMQQGVDIAHRLSLPGNRDGNVYPGDLPAAGTGIEIEEADLIMRVPPGEFVVGPGSDPAHPEDEHRTIGDVDHRIVGE